MNYHCFKKTFGRFKPCIVKLDQNLLSKPIEKNNKFKKNLTILVLKTDLQLLSIFQSILKP